MKTILNKTAATSLALMFTGSMLLTACGGTSDEAASPSAAASTSSANATATPGPKPKIKVSIYDRNNVPEGEGKITDNRWTKWINEHAPVDVEFVPVPRTNSTEKWNVLFASGDAPDLILEYSNAYMKDLAAKGQIIPLDDAIEKYSTTYKQFLKDNPIIKTLTSYNGKTFFFGRLLPTSTNHYLMIRKDWLTKLNLKSPTTMEDLYQVAKAFTEQDPDGNGKKDTLGLGAISLDLDQLFGFGITSPSWMYHLQGDQYVRSWDRLQASTELKKRLYDAGALDKDIFADKTGAKAQQDWVNGKLGMYFSDNLEGTKGYGIFDTLMKNNPNADVAVIPLPKSEFGQFSPAGPVPFQFDAAINATTKNVEAVVKYVDWLMSDSTATTLQYGLEGVHYQKDAATGCPKPIDLEKNKKELVWNADFSMLSQTYKFGKCAEFTNTTLNMSKPTDKKYAELIAQGRDAYISPERPLYYDLTLPVTLPDDLVVINNTVTTTITNIITKAVVNGSYTTEQALKDAKDAWDKAGGKKIDEFQAKAYNDYKNNGVIYTKDFYKYLKK
ncbi:extracellular solute-binding protein [Paenibacillus sp. GCM10023248]|uniref:extracellular solute-binding protein n=1 Tax=Bacillales TaxID=1385 RepID=UPI00237876E4|nr:MULTISPECIES: extracellular solute-binding protein [Bacillales]MDD9269603.1 extracellular solute-binding protein [Paenibacillus sp. MAHUQ-63]MDR6880766.1 putative aldouronate transport system substrate-binding protein [Bacillus sp. 3255]